MLDGRATCVPGNSGCSLSAADTCNGALIQTCLNGTMTTIDCAALGFRTCEITSSGGSAMRATCVN
jgi:hypothetical protein